jgi:hypothetical protein
MEINIISQNNISSVQQNVGMKILKDSLDNEQQAVLQLLDSLKQQGIGQNIDIIA